LDGISPLVNLEELDISSNYSVMMYPSELENPFYSNKMAELLQKLPKLKTLIAKTTMFASMLCNCEAWPENHSIEFLDLGSNLMGAKPDKVILLLSKFKALKKVVVTDTVKEVSVALPHLQVSKE